MTVPEEVQPLPPSPPPSPKRGRRHGAYRPRPDLRAWLGSPVALVPFALVAAVVAVLLYASGLHNFGPSFWGFNYNFIPQSPSQSSWGIGTYLAGTAVTAGLALLLATLLSLALALSMVVYLPPIPGRVLAMVTNLLAGIPSVVYGIWGFVVLAPYFGLTLEPSLHDALGWLPGFGGPLSAIGPWGSLLAVFVLTIMIIPLTTALMRESLRSVPHDLVEAGMALGATRWEVARRIRLRSASLGIWSAILLGFGRAVGESVAVAMVIGAVPRLPPSLYAPSTTLAAFLFYQLDSAFTYPSLLNLLVEFALVLMLIAVGVNILAQRLTHSEVATAVTVGGARE